MTPSSRIYLAIEGIDGTGKTYVTRHIVKKYGFSQVQEPSDGPIGSLIEKGNWSPSTDYFLFMADRSHLLNEIDRKKNLVSDRSLYSSYAYQGVSLRSYFQSLDEYFDFFMKTARLIPVIPTHVFILYSDVDLALNRVSDRGETSRFEKVGYLNEVQGLYFSLKDKLPNVTLIDSNVTLDELYSEIDDNVTLLLQQARLHEDR